MEVKKHNTLKIVFGYSLYRKSEKEKFYGKIKRIEQLIQLKEGKENENKKTHFLLRKMDFGGHTVDKDIIKKFVHTIIPRTEEEFEWYLDFDLEDKPNEERQMLWEFTIGYDEAKKYRKESNGMLRPNQWRDLMVKVFI